MAKVLRVADTSAAQGDADGKRDVALYNSSTGTLSLGISKGDGTFSYHNQLASAGYKIVRLADFTGSGKAGLLLYRSFDGLASLGAGGAGNFSFNPLSVSPCETLADVADLNGDGKADIILYNPSNGSAATGISNSKRGSNSNPSLSAQDSQRSGGRTTPAMALSTSRHFREDRATTVLFQRK